MGRRRLLARHHHGLAHGRVPRQGGLDLAQLDAVAADLDLVIEPAQEHDRPSGRRRTRSPVRYSRAPARPEKESGTNRSAVSSGRRQ